MVLMVENAHSENKKREPRLALELWLVFIVTLVLANGTIPFALGIDMHAWTYSVTKSLIFAPWISMLLCSGINTSLSDSTQQILAETKNIV
jgi:hypothetical protein